MILLVLGGARSGKSALAERYAAGLPPPVTYVATWSRTDDDPDMAARIAAHVARRPPNWTTVEVSDDLAGVLHHLEGTVLLDSLGTWVAGRDQFGVDEPRLCRALQQRHGDTVVVSDEVGLGVHPSSEAGRRFRDVLGSLNTAVAGIADAVWLVVAGRPLVLPPAPWPPETPV